MRMSTRENKSRPKLGRTEVGVLNEAIPRRVRVVGVYLHSNLHRQT